MSTQPKTARGRAKREQIVAAATQLVAERGVASTSLNDVRDRAKASKSQLYLYFDDRDALLRAVAEETCDSVMTAQADALDDFDSLAGLERYLDGIVALQTQRDARGGCSIGSLAGQLVENDDSARQVLADGFGRWEQGLREGLQSMTELGELDPDANTSLLANQVLALMQGGLLLTQVRRDPGQIRAAADAALELVRGAAP